MRLNNLNFSLMQIWYFLHVVEAGSFSGASRYLNMTQSALSKSIQSLESSIEVQLFSRDGKNLAVTEAGRYLYARWKDLLSEMEQSLSEAAKYPGGTRRSIRIAAPDSHRPETYLLDYLSRFHASCPDCDVEIESIPTDQLRKKLLEGALDAVFTVRYETEYGYWPGCGMKTVLECPHVACMLPSNPLAERDEVTVRELADMNLVAISDLYLPSYNRMLQELFAGAGCRPGIVRHTANANSQVYCLHDSRDVFICDRFHRDYGLEGLEYRPIAGTRSGVVMIWNKSLRSPRLGAFLELF